jgi:PmbA protein
MQRGRPDDERSLSSPLSLARQAIGRARRSRVDLEFFVQFGRTVQVKVYGRQIESVSVAEPRGMGARAVGEGKTGYAFTTDLSGEGIDRVIDEAVENLKAADFDASAGLPAAPAGGYVDLSGIWQPGVSDTPMQTKIDLALRAEESALTVRGVETVEESVYSDEEERIAIVSTKGVDAEMKRSYCYVYVLAHAGRGADRQSGLGFSAARDPGALDPMLAGRRAASKALGLVGARPCKTGSYTVVLDREVAAALISRAVEALSADAVQKGRSVFAGRKNTLVASRSLTLLDDGLQLEGLDTSPFDGEGIPQQTTTLIETGVLRSYLFDTPCARREGSQTRSTGSARRDSYRSLPHVGPTNLVVAAGSGTLEELLARVGDGLYVESVAGLHSGVNPVSGEISLGVTGRLVRGGSLGSPVREVTIATDFSNLLEGIRDLGGDAHWIPLYGSVYTPSLVVGGVAVSGA